MSLDSDTIKHLAPKRGLFIDIAIIGIAITGNFTDPPCVPMQMWAPFPGWLLCPKALAWPAASRETSGHLLNTSWRSGLQQLWVTQVTAVPDLASSGALLNPTNPGLVLKSKSGGGVTCKVTETSPASQAHLKLHY